MKQKRNHFNICKLGSENQEWQLRRGKVYNALERRIKGTKELVNLDATMSLSLESTFADFTFFHFSVSLGPYRSFISDMMGLHKPSTFLPMPWPLV